MRLFQAFMGIGVAILIAFSGCGDKIDPWTELEDLDLEGPVTYSDDIQSIFESVCLNCHSIEKQGPERNGAPLDVNFDTYEDAVELAERANQKIQSGTMPPDGVGLPPMDRALFQQWIDDGLLE